MTTDKQTRRGSSQATKRERALERQIARRRKVRRLALRKNRRLGRTVVLASLALLASIYWLAIEWELDFETLLDYAATGLVFVAMPVVIGVVAGGSLWLIRRWRRPPDAELDELDTSSKR